MYLPNSAFHNAFKDPSTYPQDLIIECPSGYFSSLDGDIEASGVEIEEYFCTSEDLSYGECPASTFKASLINKDGLSSMTWNDLWTVYIGYRNDRQADPLPTGVNARFRWTANDTYYYAKTDGLYYGSTLIDGSGECYSLYASDGLENLYAYGDGYTYEIDRYSNIATKIVPQKFMVGKFRTPQTIYWDSDFQGNGYGIAYRSQGGYTEEWYYIPMGTFFVEKPSNFSNAVVDISGAFDLMRDFDKESTHLIESMNTSYPQGATVREWVLATCTEASAPSPVISEISADTYSLDPSTARTLREILAYLAECYKGVFRYGRVYGEMLLSQIGTTAVETIEPRRIRESSLTVAEYSTGTPDAIINKTPSGLTYIRRNTGNGEWKNPYYILGNPFILNNDTVTLADIQFPPYRPIVFDVLEADPCVDVGDLIDVKITENDYSVLADIYDHPYEDDNGNVLTIANQPLCFPLMHRVLRWNGVCTATYECTGNEYRLAPDGAELTQYNSNTANDTGNIINKIEAHGINADWIKTGILESANEQFYLDMDNGEVNMASANITGGYVAIATEDDPDNIDSRIAFRNKYDDGAQIISNKTEFTAYGYDTEQNFYASEDDYEADNPDQTYYVNAGVNSEAELNVGFTASGASGQVVIECGSPRQEIRITRNSNVRLVIDMDGITFTDSNGVDTASYPSTGLGVVALNNNFSVAYGTDTTSHTYTLATNGTYLVTTARYSSSGTSGSYDGVWLVTAATNSHIAAIKTPTGNAPTIGSGRVLTYQPSYQYMMLTVTKLS